MTMRLSEEIKSKIRAEYEGWFESQYGNLSTERRKELGAIYTPPEITIQMIERFPFDEFGDRTVLDPACGSGNLLIACIIAGAKPENIYGNELELSMVELCRSRLTKYGVPAHNIHQGDATDPYCLKVFRSDYKWPRQTSVALF